MTLTSCRRPKMTKDCKRNAASDFVQTHIYSGYGYIQNSLLFLQFLSYKDISGKEFILCFFKIQLLCFFNESLNHFTDLSKNIDSFKNEAPVWELRETECLILIWI